MTNVFLIEFMDGHRFIQQANTYSQACAIAAQFRVIEDGAECCVELTPNDANARRLTQLDDLYLDRTIRASDA